MKEEKRERGKRKREVHREGEMEEEKKAFIWSHRSQENPAIYDEV